MADNIAALLEEFNRVFLEEGEAALNARFQALDHATQVALNMELLSQLSEADREEIMAKIEAMARENKR